MSDDKPIYQADAVDALQRERDELAAQVQELREALRAAANAIVDRSPAPFESPEYNAAWDMLSRAPAASLAAHDAQVWREVVQMVRGRADIMKRKAMDERNMALLNMYAHAAGAYDDFACVCDDRAAGIESQAHPQP